MKICVTQRDGIRYFSRFTDLGERDKLYVEVTIEDRNGGKPITIDLTTALIEEYSRHPEMGKVSVTTPEQIVKLQPLKPLTIKAAKEVTPAYIEESKKQKDEVLAKVREAQQRLVDERKQKEAKQAAARAERLAAARKAKAEKQVAESKAAKPAKPAKATPPKTTKSKAAAAAKTEEARLAKLQQEAIKKIGNALAREEKAKAKSKAPAAPSLAKAVKATATKTTAAKTVPAKNETPKPASAKSTKAVAVARAEKPAADRKNTVVAEAVPKNGGSAAKAVKAAPKNGGDPAKTVASATKKTKAPSKPAAKGSVKRPVGSAK
jgi:hypothetical protein